MFLGMGHAIAGRRDQAIRNAREALAIQLKVPGNEWAQTSAYLHHVAGQVAASRAGACGGELI